METGNSGIFMCDACLGSLSAIPVHIPDRLFTRSVIEWHLIRSAGGLCIIFSWYSLLRHLLLAASYIV